MGVHSPALGSREKFDQNEIFSITKHFWSSSGKIMTPPWSLTSRPLDKSYMLWA